MVEKLESIHRSAPAISLGNLINDPFPTNSASSSFDLDAIGAINIVPEPGNLVLAGLAIRVHRGLEAEGVT